MENLQSISTETIVNFLVGLPCLPLIAWQCWSWYMDAEEGC